MATFLSRGNFNGDYGSHFFIDLYYDTLSSTSVRFYVYIGSVDGYSASGTSTPVYINNQQVGSISSIPARSNVNVGYLDITGSGSISAAASISTAWNHVGSASTSGSVTVGDYITSFSVEPINETSVKLNWSVSSPADYGWYSLDQGQNWYDLPTSNIIGGLNPGYQGFFQIRLRQASTQTSFTSGVEYGYTYNYPYIQVPGANFTIGDLLSINIYNPLHRTCQLYIIGNNGAVLDGGTTTDTSITGYNNNDWKNWWYSTIPNSPNGAYKVRLIVNELGRDTTVDVGTYSVVGNESPIISISAVDTDKTLTNGIDPTATTTDLTGSNKKIIKFISDVEVTFDATAQYSANISSTRIKYNNDSREVEQSAVSVRQIETFDNVENITFSCLATDTRVFRMTDRARDLTLIDYVKLTIDELEIYRTNQTDDTLYCRGDGNYFSGSFGNTTNSITFQFRYKLSTSSTWGNWITESVTVGSDNDYSFSFEIGTDFDYTKRYDFQFKAIDKCMTTNVIDYVVKPGIPVLGLFENFHEAFGVKTFEKDNDGNVELNKDVKIGRIGRLLWSGTFTSGSITVNGLSNYQIIIVKLDYDITCIGSKQYGGGGLLNYGDMTIVNAAYRFNNNGDTLTIDEYNKGGSFNGNSIAIKDIYGLF